MPAQRSIVICGGAFAGLALALALRQGLGRRYSRHRGRSGAGRAAEPRSARDRHRRRLPAAVRGAGRLGPGRAERAADPRHGRDRFQARRCHPSGVPDLCRRCRARRAVRAYGRKPSPDRCAGGARRGRRRRSSRHRGRVVRFAQRRRRRDARGRHGHRGESAGRRRRRALETARACRDRHPWLGLRSIRHRRHRRP